MATLSPQCLSQSVGIGNTLITSLIQALLASYCAISPPEMWPEDYGPIAIKNGLDDYDFVVIGAGTAGSIVASRLSENPKFKVLLLEAGGNPPIESEVPLIFFENQRTENTWNYFTEPSGKACLGMKNQVCYWPRGKVIGGSGAINAMLWVRGNRQDFDLWKDAGNTEWGWDNILPYFEKTTQDQNITKKTKTLTALNDFAHFEDIMNIIEEAAIELGNKILDEFDDGSDLGYAYVPGNVHNGQRASTAKTHLAAAMNRPNLHVIKNAVVKKIYFDGTKVSSVNFLYKNEVDLTVDVKKEVILSAGAIDSPKLLMLSGIGPKAHLNHLGIPVVQDLRVGDNLQDHLIIPVVFKLLKPTIIGDPQKIMMDNIYNYLMHKTGPFSSNGAASLVGFINSDKTSTSPYPDIEFHHIVIRKQNPGLLSYAKVTGFSESITNSLASANEEGHTLFLYVVLLRPKSIGNIRLRSGNYWDPPKIFANYLDEEEDVKTVLRGIKYQLQFEETRAFKENGGEIIELDIEECKKYEFKSDEYWKCYIKYMSTTVYHPTSTSKMGPDSDDKAVVDGQLRVKGIQGLRVVDASIMPNIVSGNTNAPTIMIAERASHFIRDEWKTDKPLKAEL